MCADDSGMGTKLPLCCHLDILLATVQVIVMKTDRPSMHREQIGRKVLISDFLYLASVELREK